MALITVVNRRQVPGERGIFFKSSQKIAHSEHLKTTLISIFCVIDKNSQLISE